jgi:hypothetical protein
VLNASLISQDLNSPKNLVKNHLSSSYQSDSANALNSTVHIFFISVRFVTVNFVGIKYLVGLPSISSSYSYLKFPEIKSIAGISSSLLYEKVILHLSKASLSFDKNLLYETVSKYAESTLSFFNHDFLSSNLTLYAFISFLLTSLISFCFFLLLFNFSFFSDFCSVKRSINSCLSILYLHHVADALFIFSLYILYTSCFFSVSNLSLFLTNSSNFEETSFHDTLSFLFASKLSANSVACCLSNNLLDRLFKNNSLNCLIICNIIWYL